MSGLEGAAFAAGGRLLGGLAAPAGQSLAGKVTFRWRVWWRVRKRVDFSFRQRTYRKWLKTITSEELAEPVESIHGPLAKRLDDALSTESSGWASTSDHLSRALRLVEETYPATAAALRDGDRAELCERWAQQRSVSVRELVLQLVGPGAALSREDLAMVLQHRSAARRAVRLQPFEVDESIVASYFYRIQVPDVPARGVVVLLGDFGSGKSETAEAWHRAAIKHLSRNEVAPLPVWLGARDLLGQTLEMAVDRLVGPAWRHGRGASIVVDGLDETDPAAAQGLLNAARTLTKTHVNVQVLLTARPGILSPSPEEETTAPLLTEEEALELVELAGGRSHDTWGWTPDMRATVRRPFFALAAGVMLGGNEAPRGQADLIRSLVEHALSDGAERSAMTAGGTRSVLEKLAVALTRTGHDGLSFGDRLIARSSRLVAEGPDGSTRFSLPILQHWFAAQAILDGDVPAEEVVADANSFNRWRWAAAVAAVSASGAETVDALLGTWVAGNAGAAGWIIKEAFSGRNDWRTEDEDDLDAETSGVRLLRALRTWTEALGPLAHGVLPYPLVEGPVTLGVTVSGQRINVAFSTECPEADRVTEVPAQVHPFNPTPAPEWLPWITGRALRGDAWPWKMVRKQVAAKTLKKLSTDYALGARDGVWVQERRFDLARSIADRASLFFGDLPAEEIRSQAADLLDLAEGSAGATFQLRSKRFSGAELEELVAWIDETATERVSSHLPARDVEKPTSGFVWDFYSSRRLMEFEAEVYGRACEAYDEAMTHTFANLGWSMPSSSLSPFDVILEVRRDGDGRRGVPMWLTAIRVPTALMAELAPAGSEAIWSTSRRAVITRGPSSERAQGSQREDATLETIRSWLAEQNREPIGGLSVTSTGAVSMTHVRPASSVAAQWLWTDLQGLGLGSGTFPQLV